jgi:molecular chaperone GrpE
MADEQSPEMEPEANDDALESADGALEAETGEAIEPSVEDTLAQLESDLAEAKDAALRAQADALNVQRRSEQEIEKARKFALERFSGELLPVVDNLERALEAAVRNEDNQAMIEGVELTLKSLTDVLAKHGIESIDPMGAPFDPQTAQAMSMIDNPDVEPNTVIAVMQKGYSLNGRLLRPAMVMVSKAAD